MKSIIHKTGLKLMAALALFTTGTVMAQIDYYQDFANANHGWTTRDFERSTVATCTNSPSFRANAGNSTGRAVAVETVSPSIGISNGEAVTLSYEYKLLNYDATLPTSAVAGADWGMVTVAYGPTLNGPWTEVDVISPQNYRPVTDCNTQIISFTPREGDDVFLRYTATPGTSLNTNFFIYIDGVSAYQEVITTMANLPAENNVMVYPNPVTDFLNLTYDGTLTDVLVFNMQGQEIPLTNLYTNVNRIDLSTLEFGEYQLKLVINDEIKTIDIKKN